MTMKCEVYFQGSDNGENRIMYEIANLEYDDHAVILEDAVQRTGPGNDPKAYQDAIKHEVGFPMVNVIRWILT